VDLVVAAETEQHPALLLPPPQHHRLQMAAPWPALLEVIAARLVVQEETAAGVVMGAARAAEEAGEQQWQTVLPPLRLPPLVRRSRDAPRIGLWLGRSLLHRQWHRGSVTHFTETSRPCVPAGYPQAPARQSPLTQCCNQHDRQEGVGPGPHGALMLPAINCGDASPRAPRFAHPRAYLSLGKWVPQAVVIAPALHEAPPSTADRRRLCTPMAHISPTHHLVAVY
jgi:hypothetical protein